VDTSPTSTTWGTALTSNSTPSTTIITTAPNGVASLPIPEMPIGGLEQSLRGIVVLNKFNLSTPTTYFTKFNPSVSHVMNGQMFCTWSLDVFSTTGQDTLPKNSACEIESSFSVGDHQSHLPAMTQLEYCMCLSATNGGDNEIDRPGRNLDLNQCPRYMPYTMRGYMNHRRRYLLPDGYSTVSDDLTRVPTGVFVGCSRTFSLDYIRSVYPFGGSTVSRLLRLRVPQDMTHTDRIHLAELVILDVHNSTGTTSASSINREAPASTQKVKMASLATLGGSKSKPTRTRRRF
jgi:hypothetical protein